jgi:hypothetical protein
MSRVDASHQRRIGQSHTGATDGGQAGRRHGTGRTAGRPTKPGRQGTRPAPHGSQGARTPGRAASGESVTKRGTHPGTEGA